jgi:shikimate dehydrogenase
VHYKLGLIGYPVSHSLSPRMHAAALQALAMDGDYTAVAVAPECLRDTLSELVARGYDGLNVTIPHKQSVMPCLDDLAPSARAIGAVNTIVKEGGRLVGHNTDAAGFTRGLAAAGFDPHGAAVLVIGAGGAARAVLYSLAQTGARVTIWNRTHARAAQLAVEFGANLADAVLPARRWGEFALIVNTTSVGMHPHDKNTPLPLLGRGLGAHWVYDLVYRPRETVLLREARAVGALTIGGLEMLVYQGAESFRLWTGREAPVSVMRQAVSHC